MRASNILGKRFASLARTVRTAYRLHRVDRGKLEGEDLRALVAKPDPVILDIGCNNGGHTRWFLDLFAEARVFCFEPDPRARERFESMVDDQRVVLSSLAISDRDGSVRFYPSGGEPPWRTAADYPHGWDASGSIRRPKKHLERHPWCTFDEPIEVESTRLDSWFEASGLEQIDLIWADVQGAEVDLVRGGPAALRNTRYLYTEYSNTELYEGQIGLRDLLGLLPGFEPIRRYRSDVLLGNTGWQSPATAPSERPQ